MKAVLWLVLASILAGLAYWVLQGRDPGSLAPAPAGSGVAGAPASAEGVSDPGSPAAKLSAPPGSNPARVAEAGNPAPGSSVPEGIIDPNHELLAATNQPEPRDAEGEKRPEPAAQPPADFVGDPELAQKYAGGRPEDLREMVRTLQALLDEDYVRLKSGQPAALTDKQQTHIQHEIEWLKAHGGS